ncbi:MAG: two-component sensor histidine kinase [Alphaproteobacteria bacterium]|jgi:two-component system osmolarity sensor histidine kinase EnvZ|uniref:ATP-binding protein n=1 Tax=Loktanella salsilacus TaxID=195913 RepID=UPI001EC9DE4E|nr:ATP-binding protein [Loktanella salsilacus]MBU0861684.1 two-component sensor histidine kinase [Alphaproteobacteria bacterium]UTH46508.1 two-component sensor histidine kinase [Loktanella salsilacus]
MFFQWLKRYMPRGLYTRALIILILPVLSLQLLVSIVFIQRHFEGVTRQMTAAVAIDLRYLRDLADAAPNREAAITSVNAVALPLELAVSWPYDIPDIVSDRQWFDFTGRTVAIRLREAVPQIGAVSMADRRRVTVWIATEQGPMSVDISRTRLSASNPHQLLVIMVVLGAVLTAISYIFLRNQLRPITRMARAAADYGKGRITPYHPGGAAEVRAAGMAFLDMRNRLERQIQQRTMMLSGVSHDLRTPLTRLRLGLSLLDDEEAEPLTRDVDEMQRLLDSFLDFARSDAGDAMERVDPASIVRDLVADFTRIGLAVTLQPGSGPQVTIPMRPAAIRRALDNLVGNALRYGNKAHIAVHVTDRAIRYVVEDDGPGIPADQHDDAIRPFTRLDAARNQDKGAGVGLGLAIVADIARSHGGVLRLSASDTLGGLKAELVLAR